MDPIYYGLADLTTWLWVGAIVGIICGSMTWGVFGALLAGHKDEDPGTWYLICALTGVIGLSVLACKPRRRAHDRLAQAPVPDDLGVIHDEIALLAAHLVYTGQAQAEGGAQQQGISAGIDMTNYGSSPVSYSARQFVLVSLTDQQRYRASRLLDDGQPFCGTLQPGQTISGDLVFDAPAEGEGFSLRWEPAEAVSVDIPFLLGSSLERRTALRARPALGY